MRRLPEAIAPARGASAGGNIQARPDASRTRAAPAGRGAPVAGVGATRLSTVVIYTDGACKGNPGPGGWGALLRAGAHEKELFGGEAHTTNNRMELTAVIRALRVADARVPGGDLHRLAVREERHRDVDPRLAAQRLEDGGQEARQERGPVARARRARRAAPRVVALGEGPRRQRRQPARRCARQPRRRRCAAARRRAPPG